MQGTLIMRETKTVWRKDNIVFYPTVQERMLFMFTNPENITFEDITTERVIDTKVGKTKKEISAYFDKNIDEGVYNMGYSPFYFVEFKK